jgi:hypothetical protein
MAFAKTACPVTRSEFRRDARDLVVVIDGKEMLAEAREFATGSLGWNATGKMLLKVGDRLVSVQVGVNLTLVGSKEARE